MGEPGARTCWQMAPCGMPFWGAEKRIPRDIWRRPYGAELGTCALQRLFSQNATLNRSDLPPFRLLAQSVIPDWRLAPEQRRNRAIRLTATQCRDLLISGQLETRLPIALGARLHKWLISPAKWGNRQTI